MNKQPIIEAEAPRSSFSAVNNGSHASSATVRRVTTMLMTEEREEM